MTSSTNSSSVGALVFTGPPISSSVQFVHLQTLTKHGVVAMVVGESVVCASVVGDDVVGAIFVVVGVEVPAVVFSASVVVSDGVMVVATFVVVLVAVVSVAVDGIVVVVTGLAVVTGVVVVSETVVGLSVQGTILQHSTRSS